MNSIDLLVRVTRTDGSVTYKGPYRSASLAARETRAWLVFTPHDAEVVPYDEFRTEFKEWKRHVNANTDKQGRQTAATRFFPRKMVK